MAAISAKEQPGMQQIDLSSLNIQQLTQIKNQLNQVRLVSNQNLKKKCLPIPLLLHEILVFNFIHRIFV